MKKSNFCLFLSVLLLTLLVGCAGRINDPNFTIPKDNQYGYIAFSVYNNCSKKMEFKIDRSNVAFDSRNFFVESNDILIEKGDGNKNYILRRYPPGNYVIKSLDPIVLGMPTAYWDFVYKFKVYPGRVTYIGSFYVDIKNFKEKIDVMNAFAKDIPVLLRRYKNVPANKYKVGIVKKSKR